MDFDKEREREAEERKQQEEREKAERPSFKVKNVLSDEELEEDDDDVSLHCSLLILLNLIWQALPINLTRLNKMFMQ